MTVTAYGETTGTITHRCPLCEREYPYVVKPALIVQHRPDRGGWSLALGPCPGCGSSHHLNLNLPDDHPDPAAGHINRMLRQHLGPNLPPATVPATPMPTRRLTELAPPAVADGPDHQERQQADG